MYASLSLELFMHPLLVLCIHGKNILEKKNLHFSLHLVPVKFYEPVCSYCFVHNIPQFLWMKVNMVIEIVAMLLLDLY